MPAVFLYPGLAVILLIGLLPFVYAVGVSFQYYYLGTPGTAHWVGLANFATLFQDEDLWNSVVVTARYIAVSVSVETIIGFGIALLLHARLRFNGFIRTTILIPMILAPVVAGSMWKFMLNSQSGVLPFLFGLIGFHSQYLGGPDSALWWVTLADLWQWTPFVVLVTLAGLSTLPVEPFEAAAVDGASRWQVFRHITLPLMRPYLLIAVTLRFIAAYKSFDAVFIMTGGGPGALTQVLGLRLYQTAFVALQIGEASALALLINVVAILVTRLVLIRLLRPRATESVT
jgi:multiple sugar transport system permease protein